MNLDEAEDKCICGMCPSYVDCGERLAFCLWETGKSKCITTENGCTCPACPVQEEMHYQLDYYCTRGSEKEQTSH